MTTLVALWRQEEDNIKRVMGQPIYLEVFVNLLRMMKKMNFQGMQGGPSLSFCCPPFASRVPLAISPQWGGSFGQPSHEIYSSVHLSTIKLDANDTIHDSRLVPKRVENKSEQLQLQFRTLSTVKSNIA